MTIWPCQAGNSSHLPAPIAVRNSCDFRVGLAAFAIETHLGFTSIPDDECDCLRADERRRK